MEYAYFIIFGYALGLSLAAPPGPVNAIMASESLKSSLHGTSIGAGAMTADAVFLVLVYSLRFVIPSTFLPFIYLLGGFIMIYLAYSVINSKLPSKSRKGNYFVGLTMGLTNPFQIVWWITVGIFMIDRFSLLSMLGFFLGIVTWILMFPMVMSKINARYSTYVKWVSSSILVAFGIYMIATAVTSFRY